MNLSRHFQTRFLQVAVLLVLALLCARLLIQILAHYGGRRHVVQPHDNLFETSSAFFDQFRVDRDAVGIATNLDGHRRRALLILMMTGMPLGIVTLIISVCCAIAFYGLQGMYLVSTNAVDLLEKYPLVAVPFFVLMASILERAGIAQDLFDAMSIFAGGLRGGVALQTTIVAVILAAMSGVMGGEIVMLGLVALPQMLRLGYDRKLTIGLICAAGALATLIPPSIVMIVYGLSANVGIGDLFTAGFIPGLMLATFYVSYVLIRCNLNPSLAPTAAEIAEKTGNGHKARPASDRRRRHVHRADHLCHGVDLWRHHQRDGSRRRRRLRRHRRRRRALQVQLRPAARLPGQHHGRGRHHHLADPGRGRLRRTLQPDRRLRLHARADQGRRPGERSARSS